MGAPIYDVMVIGSGPAGQKGAINAAKLHKRVALIDRKPMLGGVSVHTGTIPSKTVREAILHLTGFTERTFYGRDYSLKENISVQDLAFRVNTIVERETQVIHAQLKRNGVAVFEGGQPARLLVHSCRSITALPKKSKNLLPDPPSFFALL